MFTFKSKLDISVLIIVVLLAVLAYLVVIPRWATSVEDRARADIRRASKLVREIQRLYAYDLVAQAKEAALRADMVDGIQQQDEPTRRQAIFDAITDFDRHLRQRQRKADFLAVVDQNGRVVARDLNIEDMYGEKLPYPSIARALAGRAASDVWFMKNRMMRAGVAPISVAGEVRGAVVLAYDFTAADARAESRDLNVSVSYFMDKAVPASSFLSGEAEDSAALKAISRALVTDHGPVMEAISAGAVSGVFTMDIEGAQYLAAAGPLPEAITIVGIELSTRVLKTGKRAETISGTSHHNVGFVVLANLRERMSRVRVARYMIGLVALLVLLLLLTVKWAVTTHFVNAEDHLELGVNEVMNGNLDYTFDSLQEFEGLANALNVMLAHLLGRPEPGEEEDAEAAWRPDVLPIEELGAVPAGVDVQQLAGEAESAYYARLHQQYVAARQAAQLPIDGITLDSFSQKVRANEAILKARHKCNLVRFVVHSAGGRVSLVPVRLG